MTKHAEQLEGGKKKENGTTVLEHSRTGDEGKEGWKEKKKRGDKKRDI
jgi:hypothetical protein